MAKVIFTYEGEETTIQCSKEDQMKNICCKYASKIDIDRNSLYFLYGGNKVNLDLSFEQLANSIDKADQEMKILVYKKLAFSNDDEGDQLEAKIIDNICLSNNVINDNLIGIKGQIDNLINDIVIKKEINFIISQLKNINLIINNALGEIKKNNEKLNQLKQEIKKNENIKNLKCNIIKGVLDIKVKDINDGVFLFNKRDIDGIDVFLNDNKIDMINEKNKWKIDYNFKEDGKYKFKIVFNNNITSLYKFFQDCSNLYSIDLSNFESKNVTDLSYMFNKCYKLKEIIGMSNFNTSNVNNMKELFHCCYNLESLDLSNLDTFFFIYISFMFNSCVKLKEIKGINEFITNNVIDMCYMFGNCKELEYLDLSGFQTQCVRDMKYMFADCAKLKEIKGISKFNTGEVNYINSMFAYCQELEFLDLSGFDTSKVCDMSFMFNKCVKLKEIKGIEKFNTNKVGNMTTMFQSCCELENLDLSNFDTSNVYDMSFMFNHCSKLKYLNISKFQPQDATRKMFFHINKYDCKFTAENNDLVVLFYSSK